jgi:pimeloyl-ACP methyl ester carboxylesterase
VRPPVLFIHGAFSHPGHFAGWLRLFSAAGYDCRAPALPGHAPSDRAALAALTLDDYLAALRAEAGRCAAPPVVVGHSMGGLLAQQLATLLRCRALVCIASAPPWRLPATLAALPDLLPLMRGILLGRAIRPPETTFRRLALHDLPEDEQRALLPAFGAESGRAYRAMILGLARLRAKPFAGPVLVLSGSADRLVPAHTSAAIARLYGARHEVFDRGHWLIAPSAEAEVASRTLRWLDGALSTASGAV